MNHARLIINTDGGARGNPGPAAVGVVIRIMNNELRIKSKEGIKFGKHIGDATNNVAEYTAVIEALNYLKTHDIYSEKIDFFLDANLVVQQLSGIFKIKNPTLKDLFLKIRFLEKDVGRGVTYTHIPREKNQEADRLVNEVLDES